MKRLYIETYGCQMNMLDSELVVAALRKDGYELTDSPEAASAILINTCSIREQAENKVCSQLGRLKQLKASHPEKVIGVRGRGVTFVGQTESGSIQIIANDDARLGRQPFLRLYAVGIVEDQPVFHGSCFLKLEIVD